MSSNYKHPSHLRKCLEDLFSNALPTGRILTSNDMTVYNDFRLNTRQSARGQNSEAFEVTYSPRFLGFDKVSPQFRDTRLKEEWNGGEPSN